MTEFQADTLGMVAAVGGAALPTVVFEFGAMWNSKRQPRKPRPGQTATEAGFREVKWLGEVVIFRAHYLTRNADETAVFLAERQKRLKRSLEGSTAVNFDALYDVSAWPSYDRLKVRGLEPRHWVRIANGDAAPEANDVGVIGAGRNWLVTHAIDHLGDSQPGLSFDLSGQGDGDGLSMPFTDGELQEHLHAATAKPPRIGGNPDEILELDLPERISCALGWVCWLSARIKPETPMDVATFRKRQWESQRGYSWVV